MTSWCLLRVVRRGSCGNGGVPQSPVVVLVDAVRSLDKNGNDYVCASSIRGTRAFLGDPLYANYYFLVIDDKHV